MAHVSRMAVMACVATWMAMSGQAASAAPAAPAAPANPLADGPLGIHAGDALASVGVAHKISAGFYAFEPKVEMMGFEKYFVHATDQTGVCAVSMVTDAYQNDPGGESARFGFTGYSLMLDKIYGPGKSTDWQDTDVPPNHPDWWTGEIMLKKRKYSKTWGNAGPLIHNLHQVELSVISSNPQSPQVVLSYMFNNIVPCTMIISGRRP